MFSNCIYIFKPQILCLSRFVYPSIHLSISSSIHLSISQSIYLSAYPSIQLSICSSIYMAICICIWANCSNCSAFVDSLALLAFHSFYRYKSQWDALSTPALLLSRVFVFVCVNVSNTKRICVCVCAWLWLWLSYAAKSPRCRRRCRWWWHTDARSLCTDFRSAKNISIKINNAVSETRVGETGTTHQNRKMRQPPR